jgi:hypothetical protein
MAEDRACTRRFLESCLRKMANGMPTARDATDEEIALFEAK